MVYVPLIPKSKDSGNLDVSHILQEAFQDFIDPDELCQNVTRNVCKYNLDNVSLTNTGEEIVSAYDGTKLCMDDIGHTEHQLMISQALYLKREDTMHNDLILLENLKLYREPIFEDLEVQDVIKHQLLQKVDLLPSKPEISMDFRMNSNQHLCDPPCEAPSEIIEVVDEIESCISEHLKLQSKQKTRRRLRTPKLEVIFKAEPKELEFLEYRLGVTYEKKFKLRNVTKTTRTFVPQFPSKNSYFKVELYSGVTRVASGMFVVFSVKFRPTIFKDVEDQMTINTFTGEDVVVKFRSYRTPPRLLAFIYKNKLDFEEKHMGEYDSDFRYSEERQLALNSSIDCGGCLVGKTVVINVIIKNEGNDGKFFLLSEDEWYFSEVTYLQPTGKLTLGSFVIYPTYFQIKRNQYIELHVTFASEEFGLAVEKLFLLCDNNTVEELELIADGVIFDKTSVLIDKSLLKNRSKESFDSESGFVLNYKQALPRFEYVRFVTVYNNSCIRYKYKWIIRETISDAEGIMFDKMEVDWISIRNPPHDLNSNNSTDFEIVLNCPLNVADVYSMVLILHVLDIPETSLAEDASFCVLEKSEEELEPNDKVQTFDVVIGEIEIVANILAITIEFNPSIIKITDPIEINSGVKHKIELTLSTSIDTELYGIWTVSDDSILEVYPFKITLVSNVVYICDVRIQITRYEDVHENISFKIANTSYRKDFDIQIKVVKPKAKFLTNSIHFGVIHKNQIVPSRKICIQNTGLEPIEWSILECTYDFDRQKAVYFDSLRHLDFTKGVLLTGQTFEVNYTIDSVTEECKWVSFLILISVHPTQLAMDSICVITYEVAEPKIKIHSGLSKFPLIFPGKLLYLGCKTHYQLCVHNVGKKVAGSFTFGLPEGQHANYAEITFEPRSGVVCPKSCVHVIMTIIPLLTGVIDDLQISCNIEHAENPIVLTFMCVVDNIHLNYYLPNVHGNFTKIFWPSHSYVESRLSITSTFDEDVTESQLVHSYTSTSFQRNSLFDTKIDSFEESELPSDLRLNIESSSEINFINVTSSSTNTSQLSLEDYFTGHLELHQHLIEFKSIPLRTPVKKTIIIENLTPILGDFHIHTTYFHPIRPTDTKERALQQILEDINLKSRCECDEWDECVNSEYGILVKFTPSFGCVCSSETLDVDVWVYANTWGAYIEEATIYVNEIEPFHFNLLIEAVGIPLEYPMSLNSIVKETVIRFGSIPYLSEPITRTLKIKNYSCIPLNIVWHTFLLGGHPTNFNLIMESFDDSSTSSNSSINTNMSMKLLITNKYHGIQDNLIFQVSPTSIRLKPKGSKELRITLDPKTVSPKLEKTQLQGVLIGYIHLTNKYKFQSNVFVRKTDIEIAPAKVKLLGTIDLPILELQLLQGDLKIGAFANDILNLQEICYKRQLIFRNVHSALAEVTMNIKRPFKVANLSTIHAKTEKQYYSASVPHGYCLQALIECVIDAEQVILFSDMLFNTKATVFPEVVNFDNNAVIIKRNLEIYQDGVRMQVVPMEFTIFYPSFKASHKTIAFGVVFVGNTKESLLTLYNTTVTEVPFVINKPTLAKAFEIKPSKGTIPKSNGRVTTSITLKVFFTPSESKKYQEVIRVASNIPFLYVTVTLTGSGTFDEKFYVEGV